MEGLGSLIRKPVRNFGASWKEPGALLRGEIVPTSTLRDKRVRSIRSKCCISDMLADGLKLRRAHEGARGRRYPQESLGMGFGYSRARPLRVRQPSNEYALNEAGAAE